MEASAEPAGPADPVMGTGWRRVVKGVLVVLLMVGGGGVTAGYFYLRSSADPPEGTLRFGADTLSDEVRVQVDAHGVPYVSSATLEDALFAQGFLHATDRLFQMVVLRRTASGRLSEIFGPAALGIDRVTRTLDLWGAAGSSEMALTTEERDLVEAYVAGVNAGIQRRSGPLPPEFLILRFRPEPWTIQASLAVGKVMALDLSPWARELDRFHASRTLPPEKYRFVAPRYPDWAPTILADSVTVPSLGSPASVGSDPGVPSGAEGGNGGGGGSTGSAAGSRMADGWDPLAWLAGRAPLHGSNAWAVGPGRTSSGSPLLANDMHLGLQAPPTWYIMSLRTRGTYRVAGFTLPGVPGVVVGMNPDVAWGFTNGYVDDMDFTVERIHGDGGRYREGDRWRPLTVRPESIRVRGREEHVIHRVRSTSRGPLVSDALPGMETPLSVRWTAGRATTEFRGLLAMNRARDAEAFDRAILRFSSPQQNVVYATAGGTIGYRLSGSVPLREDPDGGMLPADSAAAARGWTGYWPPERLPSAQNPESGYLATANNLQAPNLFGIIGADYPLPFRALRIEDRLRERRDWDVSSTVRLQRDTRSLLGERLRDRAVEAYRRAGLDAAAVRLERWDLEAATDRHGAPLFYLWFYALRDLVAADEYAEGGDGSASSAGPAHFPDEALLRLLESRGDGAGWVDDVSTPEREALSTLEERAARAAAGAAEGRTWGELHRELHGHPLGRVAVLDALFGFDVGPFPGPGGPYTVRPDDRPRWSAMDGSAWQPPLVSRKGPSELFVAEMGPFGAARGHFLVPTGQSGNPFSPHYRDLLPRWRSGRLLEVGLDSASAASRGVRGFRLAPHGESETPYR